MRLGDTTSVTAAVTNRGSRARTLTFGGCQLWIEAEGPRGEAIPQEGGGRVCLAVMSYVGLRPGETMRTQSRWTHTEMHYPPLRFTYQPPGTVRFRAVLGIQVAPGAYLRSRESATLVVE